MKELGDSCDSDCMNRGNNFTLLYYINGGVALANVIQTCVSVRTIKKDDFSHQLMRQYGKCAHPGFICLNVCAIFYTAIYRFNTQGKLTALSLMGAKNNDDFSDSSSDEHVYTFERTYH